VLEYFKDAHDIKYDGILPILYYVYVFGVSLNCLLWLKRPVEAVCTLLGPWMECCYHTNVM